MNVETVMLDGQYVAVFGNKIDLIDEGYLEPSELKKKAFDPFAQVVIWRTGIISEDLPADYQAVLDFISDTAEYYLSGAAERDLSERNSDGAEHYADIAEKAGYDPDA